MFKRNFFIVLTIAVIAVMGEKVVIPFFDYFHFLSQKDEIIRNCQFCTSKDNEECMGKAFTLLLP